jgi:hypothetical protein
MVEVLREDEAMFSPQLLRELWRHPGKWVAIKGNRLVAFGTTPTQALRRAARKGVSDVVLHRVPDDGDKALVL